MWFKVWREVIVQPEKISEVDATLLHYERKRKHNYVDDNYIFSYHGHVPKTAGSVLIIKVHLFFKEFFYIARIYIHHHRLAGSGVQWVFASKEMIKN